MIWAPSSKVIAVRRFDVWLVLRCSATHTSKQLNDALEVLKKVTADVVDEAVGQLIKHERHITRFWNISARPVVPHPSDARTWVAMCLQM